MCTYKSSHDIKKLAANGTAIGVVCVTSAANRPVVPFVGMELSRWQAGMAQYLQSRVRRAPSDPPVGGESGGWLRYRVTLMKGIRCL